jgi:hypothetical protein
MIGGRPHTEETKRAISKALMGHSVSASTRAKMSASHRLRYERLVGHCPGDWKPRQSDVASLVLGLLDHGSYPTRYLDGLLKDVGAAFTGEWSKILQAKVRMLIDQSAPPSEVLSRGESGSCDHRTN